MNTPTSRQQDICTYIGLFGALLSATCLIQLIVVTREHWITYVLLLVYLFSIFAYAMLGLQKAIAPWLLIPTAVFSFGSEIIFRLSSVYSLVIILAFVYSVMTLVIVFTDDLPERLKAKARLVKEEELAWEEKI